ncbi:MULTISPECIES: protein kinase [unclassified Spirillospora]|uniref:serine/threonine-protein kinase n=1 Tax=unclassified Spirillospora TaxID=2642701 RepID=UPI0037107438
MEALKPGDPQTMGEYRLLGRLGAGGMGRVFLGRSRSGRTVAVKVVHPEFARDPQFRRRFRREVKAAQRVGGAWTAPVLDADTDSDTPWVATGYVPGPSLEDLVERHGPLPTASVLALASGLAHALQAVHAVGLIHRDLKPSNVLVTIDGPRVIDFGIVKSVDDSVVTRTGALVGTPAFMSPEQVRGSELGPASDVFSLGSVLAYAATGRRPYGTRVHGVHALLLQVTQGRPDLGDLSGPVGDLVESCLVQAPQERTTPAAILDALPPMPPSWLPAEVVSELGRHAVGLLDLENPAAAPSTPDPAPAPSRPVPESAVDQSSAMAVPTPEGFPTSSGGPAAAVPPAVRRTPRTRIYLATGAAATTAVVAIGAAIALNSDRTAADGAPRPSRTVRGDVPAGMLGTWEGSTNKADTESGTLSRVRRNSVPGALRGRWTGTSGAITAVPTEGAGMRRTFVLTDGTVGTEAVRISTTNAVGLTCESTALLVSAEDPILAFPNRLLTQDPRCVLGELQSLTPRGQGLVWEDPEVGESANLQRS